MRKESLRNHLAPYSIYQKRATTINHAFASAIAPVSEYDQKLVEEAIILLGQNPDGNLLCVFCGKPAETWDHLVGLVENSELRGYGHQLGNLVPCCKECNSKKGSKDWQSFIKTLPISQEDQTNLQNIIEKYLFTYAKPINLEHSKQRHSQDWEQYSSLKQKVINTMREADKVADKIRSYILEEN